jgi:hypothetical protein
MKVEVVESLVFTADDGTKLNTQEELSNYQFTSYIHDWMDMAKVDSENVLAVIEYLVSNWDTLDNARKEIVHKVKRLTHVAEEEQKNRYGVL